MLATMAGRQEASNSQTRGTRTFGVQSVSDVGAARAQPPSRPVSQRRKRRDKEVFATARGYKKVLRYAWRGNGTRRLHASKARYRYLISVIIHDEIDLVAGLRLHGRALGVNDVGYLVDLSNRTLRRRASDNRVRTWHAVSTYVTKHQGERALPWYCGIKDAVGK
jgi:hypothetical protein